MGRGESVWSHWYVKCVEFWGRKGWREKDPFNVDVVLANVDRVIKETSKAFFIPL